MERFEDLLVDLLEISRYDAGAATLEANQVEWRSGPAMGRRRPAARRAQGQTDEFRLAAKGCFAEVDRRRVERILRNILVNAVEHGEGKEVVVTADTDSAPVAVVVRDFGVGLRPGESSWSSNGSGGPIRRAPAPPAEPAAAWPSRWRTLGCTAAGCRPGESAGKGSVFRLTLPRVAGQELAWLAAAARPGRDRDRDRPRAAEPYPPGGVQEVTSGG